MRTKETMLPVDDGVAVGYEGTLPHPDVMKGYANIDRSFPERLMVQSEKYTEMDFKVTMANIRAALVGQVLSFVFGIAGIVACVILSLKGNVTGAAFSMLAVIVQSVVAAIASRGDR